jgi:hypothetical protein
MKLMEAPLVCYALSTESNKPNTSVVQLYFNHGRLGSVDGVVNHIFLMVRMPRIYRKTLRACNKTYFSGALKIEAGVEAQGEGRS